MGERFPGGLPLFFPSLPGFTIEDRSKSSQKTAADILRNDPAATSTGLLIVLASTPCHGLHSLRVSWKKWKPRRRSSWTKSNAKTRIPSQSPANRAESPFDEQKEATRGPPETPIDDRVAPYRWLLSVWYEMPRTRVACGLRTAGR